MGTRSITKEILVLVSPERVFELLIKPSAIREWWQASRAIVLSARQGIWTSTLGEDEDDPDYITSATLRVFDPPEAIGSC